MSAQIIEKGPIPLDAASTVLETYFDGKDFNQPKVLRTAFANHGVVKFTIDAEIIEFPSEIRGGDLIAKTLFEDFHKQFVDVRSYYITDELGELSDGVIKGLHWLVVMKERQTGNLRVGTGSYDFTFVHEAFLGWRIDELKIHIQEMVSLADAGEGVRSLQGALSYPWTPGVQALSALDQVRGLEGIRTYLAAPILSA